MNSIEIEDCMILKALNTNQYSFEWKTRCMS